MALASPMMPPRGARRGLPDFSELYARHADEVLVFLARRCLDPELAVDLMAETFAEAYENRRKFRGDSDGEAAAWIFAIARNRLADYFRRGRAERKAVSRLGVDVPPLEHDDYARIHDLAAIDAQREVVVEQFDRLPPKHREAVRLRIVHELPYPEVAGRLGISEETARVHVSRGLRKLANAMEASGNGGGER